MTVNDDAILYERILRKDKDALEAMYDRYEKLLYSFAFRITHDHTLAEEVLQDVFMKLWHGNRVYDSSKGKFTSWLLTVTRNQAIDLIRKHKKTDTVEILEKDSVSTPEQSVEHEVEWMEKGEILREAVAKLKKDQQQMIELFYFKGFTQQKISDVYQIPLGTVKGRIRLALKHLRSMLEKEGRVMDE
ncbi:RNA polymerase sigma factor [Metabacillus sp. JX24]|uniref:RNA polymerase sigma factor n=1 Tax=Metabacillus sp. JX24 TaxID=3240759 RepID=UPI00350F987D